MLLELIVAKQRVVVVRWVVHDPASKLRGGGTNANPENQQNSQTFLFHEQ
jgi:hypothetical protein